jgi:spore maturation protein CgeB
MKFFFNGGAYSELLFTLQAMGHTIIDHDVTWLNYINASDHGKEYNAALKAVIAKTKPDVYVCTKAIKNKFRVHPETHLWVQKNVGVTVYWSQDDPFLMPMFLSNKLYSGYSIALTCTKDSFNDYTKVGIKPYLFWPAFDTVIRKFTPVPEEQKIDFVFVGTPYACTNVPRKTVVFGLINRGFKNIELYGDPLWVSNTVVMRKGKPFISGDSRLAPYYKGQAAWSDVHRIYAKAKLNLSNHVLRASMYLNDRVPMVLGVGGFLFMDKNPGMENIFRHERDVVFYDNHEDLMSKVEYFMAHPEARIRIAKDGQKTGLEKHTYQNRARQLVNILHENGIK